MQYKTFFSLMSWFSESYAAVEWLFGLADGMCEIFTSLSFLRAAWAAVRSNSSCFLHSFSSVSRASSRDILSWELSLRCFIHRGDQCACLIGWCLISKNITTTVCHQLWGSLLCHCIIRKVNSYDVQVGLAGLHLVAIFWRFFLSVVLSQLRLQVSNLHG